MNSGALAGEKKLLRKTINVLLKELPENVRKKETEEACRNLTDHAFWKNARIILAYHSYWPELDTGFLINQAIREGKTLGLPRLSNREARLNDDRRMDFYEIPDFKACPWEIHPFGMKEPPGSGKLIEPGDFAFGDVLMVVPGLAFDKDGYRLGKGGGYYDTYIQRFAGKLILAAPAFFCQIVKNVPREKHDRPVDLVCTPGEFFSGR